MSHTPGPWKVIPPAHGHETEYLCVSLDAEDNYTTLEMLPDDARLIAAAPDLLTAAEAVQSIMWMAREYADGGGTHSIEMQEYIAALTVLNNALAKAKGEAA